MREEISFKVSKDDARLISMIVDREAARSPVQFDRMSMEMDITACHANGCPLKLVELLTADEFNFTHDVYGIHRHLDRTTGKLLDCFLPRFAEKN